MVARPNRIDFATASLRNDAGDKLFNVVVVSVKLAR
jgi:hypothetical protein